MKLQRVSRVSVVLGLLEGAKRGPETWQRMQRTTHDGESVLVPLGYVVLPKPAAA